MDGKYIEYLQKWSLNVADVCRLCVNAKITMASLTQNSQIAKIFEEIIGTKLDTSNSYPHLICKECQNALETIAHQIKRIREVDEFWKRFLLKTAPLVLPGNPEPDIELVKVETVETNLQPCSGDEGGDIFENLFDNATQFIKVELNTNVDILSKKTRNEPIVRRNDDYIVFSHPSVDAYMCQQCKKNHTCTSSLLIHLELEHGNTNAFLCDYCGEQFNSKLRLRSHFTRHIKFGCSVCQKVFNSKTSLSVHRKLHQRTIDDMVKCHLCQKTFIDKGTYRDHVRYTHTDVYDAKCPVCEKIYETPKRMRVHMMRHNKEKRFQCSECPKLFMHKQEVKVHMRVHTGERPYICDVCGMSFKAMRSLQKHHLSHNSDGNIRFPTVGPAQPFTCPLCDDKCFAHSSTLSKHLKQQHPFDASTLWQSLLQRICIRCNQIFPSVESIQHHNEQMHQRFQCEICKKYFGAEETLQYHMQGHSTQERRFKCDVCGASFLKNAHLQIHKRRTHQNERPHQCHICQKGFVSNSDLLGHIKITHNKEKSHVCSICEKPYPTAGSLRQHEQKHSGVYRYRCTMCDKNFTTSQQFAMHNLRTHKQATEVN